MINTEEVIKALDEHIQRIQQVEYTNGLHYQQVYVQVAKFTQARICVAQHENLIKENESLRAECGVRQIKGYNKGKEESSTEITQLKEELSLVRARLQNQMRSTRSCTGR